MNGQFLGNTVIAVNSSRHASANHHHTNTKIRWKLQNFHQHLRDHIDYQYTESIKTEKESG